jgi:glycosyltransferase involved in cell wall biosynthesis
VTFTGLLSRERLFTELQQAEVFLFLSTKATERMPNAVMEAMLAEAFCVVSRTDDIEKLIVAGSTGQVVDDLSPEAVARAVIAALDAPDRAAYGRRASDLVRGEFSADAQMAIYADGWRRARQRRGGPSGGDALAGAGR